MRTYWSFLFLIFWGMIFDILRRVHALLLPPPVAATAGATNAAPAAAAPATEAEARVAWLESMIPMGMVHDSWYLDHDFSPSTLVKALGHREHESGLTITTRPGFSVLTRSMNSFMMLRICFGKDCMAFKPTAFLTVFSK